MELNKTLDARQFDLLFSVSVRDSQEKNCSLFEGFVAHHNLFNRVGSMKRAPKRQPSSSRGERSFVVCGSPKV